MRGTSTRALLGAMVLLSCQVRAQQLSDKDFQQAQDRIKSFNTAFQSYLRTNGFEIKADTPDSAMRMVWPGKGSGKAFMKVVTRNIDVHFETTVSTCGPLARKASCTLAAVLQQLVGLEIQDGAGGRRRIFEFAPSDLQNFVILGTNFAPAIAGLAPDARLDARNLIRCDNFDFLPDPASSSTIVSAIIVDDSDKTNYQTGQTDALVAQQTTGFELRKLSPTVAEALLFPISGKNAGLQSYFAPGASPQIGWSIWDASQQAACRVDFRVVGTIDAASLLLNAKTTLRTLEMHTRSFGLIGAYEENNDDDNVVSNLETCNVATWRPSSEQTFQLRKLLSPEFRFLRAVKIATQVFNSDDSDAGDFNWKTTAENCEKYHMKVKLQWPK